jgi:hypothetical protein
MKKAVRSAPNADHSGFQKSRPVFPGETIRSLRKIQNYNSIMLSYTPDTGSLSTSANEKWGGLLSACPISGFSSLAL